MSDGSSHSATRVLVLGAHPDDAEVFAGGLVVRHCQLGSAVRIVSVTDGSSGHYRVPPDELKQIRRQEASAAGRHIGADYRTWDFRDGYLQPGIEVREAIIREIRQFRPDLVLTHRPNDYHPDHRAVGTAVQDASYLVTVPHVCPDVSALRRDPVVAWMCDLFTRPNPLRPDVVLDVSTEFPTVVEMAACHQSQFFEWLPYHDGILETVPEPRDERLSWLAGWLGELHSQRLAFFQQPLAGFQLAAGSPPKLEIYEISEYAGKLHQAQLSRLFPGSLTKPDGA